MLPEVTTSSVQDNRAILVLNLSPDLKFFQGHFPAFTLLPAVTQIEFVMEAVKLYLNCDLKFKEIRQVKFMSPVKPGEQLRLDVKLDRKALSAAFDFAVPSQDGQDRLCSTGKISLCQA